MLNRKYNRVADEKGISQDILSALHAFTDLDKNAWYYYEIVEASNTHEFTRRGNTDKLGREYEDWTKVLNLK